MIERYWRAIALALGCVVAALVVHFVIALPPPPLEGSVIEGAAARVIDGDTFDLISVTDGQPQRVRIRLFGIDAPERGKDGSQAASDWLSLMLAGAGRIVCQRADAAAQRAALRVVATCWPDDVGRLDESVNCGLLRKGVAIEDLRFSKGVFERC